MQHALLGVLVQIVVQIPWYVLVYCILKPYSKVEKRVFLPVALVSYLAYLIYAFFLILDDGSVLNAATWLAKLNNAGYLLDIILFVEMRLFFRLHKFKLLYVLLMGVSLASMVPEAGWYIGEFLFPDIMKTGKFFTWQYMLILAGILVVLMPLTWNILGKKLRSALEEIPSEQFLFLCAAPALFTSIVVAFLYLDNYYVVPLAFGVVILGLISITGIVTYGLTLHMILTGIQNVRTEAAVQNMENQLTMQAKRFEVLTESIEEARRVRHDLRHHLSAVTQLLNKEDYKELGVYLSDYRNSVPEDKAASICKNAIVDAVVWHYVSAAEEKGAETDVVISLGQNSGINNAELCIVFGNIFENAVNSIVHQQTGRRFISARCKEIENKIILTVDNSTDGNGKKGRDIGIASVQAVAEKYNGTAQFYSKDGVYHSFVLLMKNI